MRNSVRERFIEKIRAVKTIQPVPKLSSVFTTFNEVWIYVRYSTLTKRGSYWFDVDTYKTNEWRDRKKFIVCFICGHEDIVVFIPDDKLFQWYDDVNPNRKGQWMANIYVRENSLELKVPGKEQAYDVTGYLNRYDYISRTIPEEISRPVFAPSAPEASDEELKRRVMTEPDLPGDSFHDRVVEILANIGSWTGYLPQRSYKVRPDSPYQIDVVWLRNQLPDVAIEVQIGGNETEAKDRLVHARRFGARKVVAVSAPESIPRLKSLCRYEPDLKNWLEIWSVQKVYEMYRSGRQFFKLFKPFETQKWTEEIEEVR